VLITDYPSLLELLQDAFVVDGVVYPWGTAFSRLSRVTGPKTRKRDLFRVPIHQVDVEPSSIAGALVQSVRYRTIRSRTVFDVERLRDIWRSQLGPGTDQVMASLRGEYTFTRWRLGDVVVHFEPEHDDTLASVDVMKDLLFFQERCTPRFLCDNEAWARTAGTKAVFQTPPGEIDHSEEHRAFLVTSTDRRATPGWVAEALGDDELSVWQHDSGCWGIADRFSTDVFPIGAEPTPVLHTRMRPGRGAGEASVVVEGDGFSGVVSFDGPEHTLDELADHLRGLAFLQVRLDEYQNLG